MTPDERDQVDRALASIQQIFERQPGVDARRRAERRDRVAALVAHMQGAHGHDPEQAWSSVLLCCDLARTLLEHAESGHGPRVGIGPFQLHKALALAVEDLERDVDPDDDASQDLEDRLVKALFATDEKIKANVIIMGLCRMLMAVLEDYGRCDERLPPDAAVH